VPDNIGGGVVIWDDARNTGNTDVMAQRLNPLNGAPLWALDGVPVANRTGSNQSSSVINPFGPDGTIVVVWLDNRDASVNNKIFASSLRSDGTLPLTLISFDAMLQGSKIVTRWETTDELNTREFIVEKSSDGQRYYPIGSLQAKNLVGKHQYSLDDLRPLTGENYYRLRSVDKDGKYSYSRIARINLARQLPAVVFVSPNPAIDLVKVQLSNFTDGQYQLRLVDARGTVVQSRQFIVQGSLLQFNLNLSAMPAGRYWMQIVQPGKSVISTQPIQKL
jgi:hypothetical protein